MERRATSERRPADRGVSHQWARQLMVAGRIVWWLATVLFSVRPVAFFFASEADGLRDATTHTHTPRTPGEQGFDNVISGPVMHDSALPPLRTRQASPGSRGEEAIWRRAGRASGVATAGGDRRQDEKKKKGKQALKEMTRVLEAGVCVWVWCGGRCDVMDMI